MADRDEQGRKKALKLSLKRAKVRPSERKRHEWASRIKLKYGLTPHDVALMWHKQAGKCALCEGPLESKKVWVIDHDHKTGKFRGLLHNWCNHRVLSIIERGGKVRARNALKYLWQIDSEDWNA